MEYYFFFQVSCVITFKSLLQDTQPTTRRWSNFEISWSLCSKDRIKKERSSVVFVYVDSKCCVDEGQQCSLIKSVATYGTSLLGRLNSHPEGITFLIFYYLLLT